MKSSSVRGTPYNSSKVSDDRIVSSSNGPFGAVVDPQTGVQMSDPNSNGNGVILDGISREADYTPPAAGAMDSPVPSGAPVLAKGAMRTENIAHLGQGSTASASQAGDVLTDIGGVMSRGLEGSSEPGEA